MSKQSITRIKMIYKKYFKTGFTILYYSFLVRPKKITHQTVAINCMINIKEQPTRTEKIDKLPTNANPIQAAAKLNTIASTLINIR